MRQDMSFESRLRLVTIEYEPRRVVQGLGHLPLNLVSQTAWEGLSGTHLALLVLSFHRIIKMRMSCMVISIHIYTAPTGSNVV